MAIDRTVESHLTTQLPKLIRVSQTSKHFSNLLRQPSTWQTLLKRDFNVESTKSTANSRYFKLFLRDLAKQFERMGNFYLALSCLGFDESGKTSLIFGNRIGNKFLTLLETNLKSLKEWDSESNIIDSLFDLKKDF